MLEDFERQKAELAKDSERHSRKAGERFTSNTDSIEETLKKNTIGLVSAEDFKKKREELEELKRREVAKTCELKADERKKKNDKKAKVKATLSFSMDGNDGDEDDEKHGAPSTTKRKQHGQPSTLDPLNIHSADMFKRKRLLKDPTVDTSFLPDRAREEEERKVREELRQEWLKKQEEIKQEEIEITYSYWDGSGHRRSVKVSNRERKPQFMRRVSPDSPAFAV